MEVHPNTKNSNSSNPFNINVEKELIQTPLTKTPDPLEIQVITKPSTNINIINEPPSNNNNECNLNICVNTSKYIIHMNCDESTTTIKNKSPNFKLDTKLLYK